MGVSFCKCKLPVFLYFPCINKLKDDRFVSSQPQPDKVVSIEGEPDKVVSVEGEPDKVVSVEGEPDKVVSVEENPENDEEEGVNCEKEEAVVLKSCLKKEGCPDAVGVVEKRNVKWMDLVGKELVEIQEFEPVELEEEERDIGNTTCLWFFQ